MLEIKTGQLKTRKHVLIDGHPYTVRHMGNIEQLEISQLFRLIQKYADLEERQPLTDEQIAEVDNATKKMMDICVSLFDDGGDQSKSRKLVSSLSDNEVQVLLDQIFEDDNGQPAVS